MFPVRLSIKWDPWHSFSHKMSVLTLNLVNIRYFVKQVSSMHLSSASHLPKSKGTTNYSILFSWNGSVHICLLCRWKIPCHTLCNSHFPIICMDVSTGTKITAFLNVINRRKFTELSNILTPRPPKGITFNFVSAEFTIWRYLAILKQMLSFTVQLTLFIHWIPITVSQERIIIPSFHHSKKP